MPEQNIIEKLGRTLKMVGIKVNPRVYLAAGIMFPISLGIILVPLFGTFGFLVVLVLLDMTFGLPYYKVEKMISEIEENLPDVLRHLSTASKAGATIEYALDDVAKSDYGTLSKEAQIILRDLEAGDTFDHAFMTFAQKYNSKTLERAAKIIIVAKEAGAGLAETLEAISEDIRQAAMIMRERVASTTMQITFLIFAGVVIAPAILSFAMSLTGYLGESSEFAARMGDTLGVIDTAVSFYVLFQAASIAVMMSLMREGNVKKSVIYMPVFLIISYTIFTFGKIIGISVMLEM